MEEKIATGIKARLDIIPIERADLLAIQMNFACQSERLVRRRNNPLLELFMRRCLVQPVEEETSQSS